MFFRPGEHKANGLPFNPLKALVVPRPIGWIASRSSAGVVNLAPFSYFNAVSDNPPVVIFSVNASPTGGNKDTLDNVRQVPEFTANLATWDLRDAVKKTSDAVAPEVDEMDHAGLEKAPSTLVSPPRVAASPACLECRVHDLVALPPGDDGRANTMVVGLVLGIHIDPDVVTDGLVDIAKLKPISRLGYKQYAVVDTVFEM